MATESETLILLRQSVSHMRVVAALLAAATESMDTQSLDLFNDSEFEAIDETRKTIVREMHDLNIILAGR